MRKCCKRCLAVVLGATIATPARGGALDFVATAWQDEIRILRSPAHVRRQDWRWLAPLAALTAGAFATDDRNMTERLHINATARERSATVSNAGLGVLAAIPLSIGWQGWRNRDDFQQETASMAARALADTLATGALLRAVTRRQRPTESGAGDFFRASPGASSFPSLHAASAWALASVAARRYPGWLTKLTVYGVASGVSISRVVGKEHAPSDVLVGSMLGAWIGRYVANQGRSSWSGASSFPDTPLPRAPADDTAGWAPAGSTYVPLESWVYPALDRLAAMGLIPSQTSGLRPWTRSECRRQMAEAELGLDSGGESARATEAMRLLRTLHETLDSDGGRLQVESVYLREGVIAGSVLNDSFHFGQTWANDYGRPFGRGWNSYTGFTARGEWGRFFGFVTGEVQHAPGAAADPLEVREAMAAMDLIPLPPAQAVAATDRFRLLDTYVGVRLGDFDVSVGKQSLWWGPTSDAPLSFSTNAEPTRNLRVSTVHPIPFPGFLKILGSVRAEMVLGKLGGQKYTWRPWFNAEKVTFKLTENLEMGFTRWSIFWGVGHPVTVRSLLRNVGSLTSYDSDLGATDPGDRKAGFDFRYRIPGLRNWLTVYSDSYADDDPSPLAAPRRAAINPGVYLSHVPGISRLDLRVEAPSTMPLEGDMGGDFNYYNYQYRSGNTNYGVLLGNSVGRDARAIEAQANYWFSARSRLQAGFRQLKVGARFLPGGATQSDATWKASLRVAPDCRADLGLQYERFWVPLLGGARRNLSTWLQLTWEPNFQIIKRDSSQ